VGVRLTGRACRTSGSRDEDGFRSLPAPGTARADSSGRLELTKFHSPSNQGDDRHAPANTLGIRHVAFAVEDIDAVVAGLRARGAELVGELERYEDSYRPCYVRGPEGIIIELAEQIG
jgi:catechol 2,3-dioxygenase-like lactoylglutathione lyase family enzyme